MKKLFTLIICLFSFNVMAATINVEPDTGSVIKDYGKYSAVLGNIADPFLYKSEWLGQIKRNVNCSQASSMASTQARTYGNERGLYVGGGVGFSGSCQALSVGFGLVTDDDLTFSTNVTGSTRNVEAAQYTVGFGVNYKF